MENLAVTVLGLLTEEDSGISASKAVELFKLCRDYDAEMKKKIRDLEKELYSVRDENVCLRGQANIYFKSEDALLKEVSRLTKLVNRSNVGKGMDCESIGDQVTSEPNGMTDVALETLVEYEVGVSASLIEDVSRKEEADKLSDVLDEVFHKYPPGIVPIEEIKIIGKAVKPFIDPNIINSKAKTVSDEEYEQYVKDCLKI